MDGQGRSALIRRLAIASIAWRFRGDPDWGRSDLHALGSGLLGLAIFVGLSFAASDTMGGHHGIVQRLSLASGGIWVGALTIGPPANHGRAGLAVRLVEWIRRPLTGTWSCDGAAGSRPNLPKWAKHPEV